MIRALIIILALTGPALIPLACDGGGGDPGEDTIPTEDAAIDTAAPTDTSADIPPLQDTVGDDMADTPPPPEDTIADTPPSPDSITDTPSDTPEDFADIPADVPCEWPEYPYDCAEVPYFQCGFMGSCEDGVLSAGWHEHVFCNGEEHIIDFACEHVCEFGCKDGEIMDWPESGAAFVKDHCNDAWDYDIPPLYPSMVLEDILANPDPLDGDPVAFEGPVFVGPPICTLMECPPLDPCCNACSANYQVVSDAGTIEILGGDIPQVGCHGNSCTFMDNCTPFPEAPADYILWGTLQSTYGVALYLDGWCPTQ